ncbi:HlyD family secretion protein [Tepidibacillus fermentans]|uniref:HlyD family secretion protein n=1 Tax=Tepidibacillus fermentans TaxID=1281767 RepID=A0A4R3KGC3_9BACI|nr:HlyD family efflux transporter periplasmic adaptor subunit [Tepidibacillus fermentans]TCS82456.1 HlyD family secretion protein [Tepidibacillus fermentans]
MKRIVMIFFLLSLLLIGCSNQEDLYSGTLEGEEIPILSEVGGTIIDLSVEEGSQVKKGDILAKVDDRILQAQLNEAKSAAEVAKANLDEAKAGTRNQEIKKTLSSLEQINAEKNQLLVQDKKADENISLRKAQYDQIASLLASARKTLDYQKEKLKELEDSNAPESQLKAQQEAINQAEGQVNSLSAQLRQMEVQYQMAKQDKESIQAQINEVNAQKKAQEAQLDLLKEGATPYTISRLYHQWAQALAHQEQAKIQLEKATITAPIDGIVLRKNISIHETVKPNYQLFTLLNPKKLNVKVYIPENKLNQVKIGNPALLRVDAYPNKTFKGKITFISDQAEYTPQNVQTPDERTKLVFEVVVEPTDGWNELKPGMPVDLTFDEGDHQ